MHAYLLILGDREGLRWVLRHDRMAFTDARSKAAAALDAGDVLFLYATRGCFHNPTRDRGRVIGIADVLGPCTPLKEPFNIGKRTFTQSCDLKLKSLVPKGHGPALTELVPRLRVFPNKPAWSASMRRPLLRIPEPDRKLLTREFEAERTASGGSELSIARGSYL